MQAYRWLLIWGLILLSTGIYLNENWNIFINARMLCFSCLGIE